MQTSARALTRHADPQLLSLRFSNLHHARFSTKRTSSQASLTLKDLGERLSLLARFGATAYVIQVYVINTTMSVGPSMLPTFNVRGDILVTEYISPRLNLLQKGDVVVATKPTNPRVSILKRIVGMPGDHVETMLSGTHSISTVTVPKDHVWLEGDNKGQSTDSRDYGPVPMCLVRGRVWIRFWPLAQFCVVRRKFFGRDAYAGAGVAPRGLAAAADGDADFQVAAASEDQGG